MEWNTRIMSPRNTLFSWIIILVVQSKDISGQDCFFQNDLCMWSNEGDINWVQTSASSGAGTAHYAEIPLSDATPSGPHQAVLTSTTQTHVMNMLGFYYRLGAPNTLTVMAESSGTPVQIWSRNGTNGDSWIEVDVPVPQSSSFKISFRAEIPENSTSFVGLTNITLRIGDDDCASMPCQNGAACNDGNNSFTCICNSGFKGELCQIDIRPKTTLLPITTESTTVLSSTEVSSTEVPFTSKHAFSQKTTTIKIPPSTGSTIPAPYGTASTAGKLPQTSDKGLETPTMIAVIAVASVVLLGVLIAIVWMLVYFKKRSWRPRYHHERGVSMENVNGEESIHGKWTSTNDIPGSIPNATKPGLTPVEENPLPKKGENIYVMSPSIGMVNTGYNLDNMY